MYTVSLGILAAALNELIKQSAGVIGILNAGNLTNTTSTPPVR